MKHTVEIIATRPEDALDAQRGGADRLEICSALGVGGITPSLALYAAIRQSVSMPLFVLIRVREGNFVYSAAERRVMLDDVKRFLDAGADGFVCGMNTPDGGVDVEHMTQFVKAASGKPVTFHRAIDVCRSPLQAVDYVIATGCSRILTSGGLPVIDDAAIAMIHQMADRAAETQVRVVPGGGVNKGNIARLLDNKHIVEYHHSAKMRVASPLQSDCFAMDYFKVDPNLVRLV
jgi:copper homeostasis protein